MPDLKIAPYGSWKSPISSDMLISKAVRLGQIALDGDSLYWVEMRPEEAGRHVIVKCDSNGETTDVTPKEFNVRTLVHEYGGGAFLVHDGALYFSNFDDQRLYRQRAGETPVAITPERAYRYADADLDASRGRLICVREDHRRGDEPANEIVAIPADGGEQRVLESGSDFYSNPRVSPDGSRLAWLTWNHPNMPWDGAELWTAEFGSDGSLQEPVKIAGAENESVFQPEWSPDGVLYFVSDRSGWWNLYRSSEKGIQSVVERDAEFGLPQWVFGMSTYDFASADKLICTFFERGEWQLGWVDLAGGDLEIIELPFSQFDGIRATGNTVAFVAGAPILPNSVVRLDLRDGSFEVVRKSFEIRVETTFFARPEPVEFSTENNDTAHAYYYAPQNRDFAGPDDELPPVIVKGHGGPTAATSTSLDLKIQFWTSRGFAVLDVDYRGSTGYGREYRQSLLGNWGVFDVDDCLNGAKYLVERGLVDENRITVVGGSAGGYTTLAALTFRDFFKAGASYYGISDLEALARDTHKFESRYLDGLIGPYPQMRERYQERSPIHFTERLGCPLILFQGLEDKIVPPNQSEEMAEALRQKGLPVAYLAFEGEQHGFRKAENIKRAIEAELYFYSRIFGFSLGDDIPAIPIENLK